MSITEIMRLNFRAKNNSFKHGLWYRKIAWGHLSRVYVYVVLFASRVNSDMNDSVQVGKQ